MPTHPSDAGTTDTWTSIPWSHPRGWYLVSLSLVSPASGIQAYVPSNYSPVAGTQTHNHFSCWHHRHAGPPTHGSVACTHTHTCTCALKRVSYPGNLIGQDRLCRSGTEHGQTNAPTRKLFTHIQPFSWLTPLSYHILFLPRSPKSIPLPGSSFGSVPFTTFLILIPSCHCILLWCAWEPPGRMLFGFQEVYYLSLSICHCLAELLCSCVDEVLSHNLTSFKSRHWKIGFLHIYVYVRTFFLICYYIQWALDLAV